MKRRKLILLCLLCGTSLYSAAQESRSFQLEVRNTWTHEQTDAPVVVKLSDLKTGFDVLSATVTDGVREIPSQLDDLDGDRKADELAFVIDMPAQSTRQIGITLSAAPAQKTYTPRVSAQLLIRDAKKSLAKLATSDDEAPIGIQIYGNIPEAMVDAARMAEKAAELVGGHGADLVDINFGCPVNKIARRGAGSGMMREPDKMVEITRMVVDAVKLPVTVKTRLGWDEDSKIIVELAERLQDAGIKTLTIHGRTRCQMYKGEADWTLIGKVKENPRMHIPIIGNGDIDSPEKAREAFDRYGVDGIMIGRATYGHPWIFREIRHYLDTGELLPPMSVAERVALAKRHLAKSIEVKGERRGIFEMRRHLSCYFKCLPDFKDTRMKLVTLTDPEELYSTLDYILERWGY